MTERKNDKRTDEGGYERPSERMFRRSRRARANRKASEYKEAKFVRLVFSIAAITTMIVFVVIYFFSGLYAAAVEPDPAEPLPASGITKPVLAQFSIVDIAGFIFVAAAGYAVYRKFNSKD